MILQAMFSLSSWWSLLKLPSDVNNVDLAPAVVGAFESVTKKLGKWIKKLKVKVRSEVLQKTTLLGTDTILRRVLFPKEPLVVCYNSLP